MLRAFGLRVLVALAPFVVGGLVEWRRKRRAFCNLPEPQEQAKRYSSPGSL
jgi:hypothetical protein